MRPHGRGHRHATGLGGRSAAVGLAVAGDRRAGRAGADRAGGRDHHLPPAGWRGYGPVPRRRGRWPRDRRSLRRPWRPPCCTGSCRGRSARTSASAPGQHRLGDQPGPALGRPVAGIHLDEAVVPLDVPRRPLGRGPAQVGVPAAPDERRRDPHDPWSPPWAMPRRRPGTRTPERTAARHQWIGPRSASARPSRAAYLPSCSAGTPWRTIPPRRSIVASARSGSHRACTARMYQLRRPWSACRTAQPRALGCGVEHGQARDPLRPTLRQRPGDRTAPVVPDHVRLLHPCGVQQRDDVADQPVQPVCRHLPVRRPGSSRAGARPGSASRRSAAGRRPRRTRSRPAGSARGLIAARSRFVACLWQRGRARPWADPVPQHCVATLDAVESVSTALLIERLGRLSEPRMREICLALSVAVDCPSPLSP